MNWTEVSAIATAISMVAFVTSAVVLVYEVRSLSKSRYLEVTSELFSTWQSREFMDAQLWLIHRLQETTWEDFVKAHRADYGEQAFHRVGSFYDRVGALVRMRLITQNEIVTTIGPYAIAVWSKIEPLVMGARRAENSTLFLDFERLMPACYQCYVPSLAPDAAEPIAPFTSGAEVPKMTVADLRRRIERGDPIAVVDARKDADDAAGGIPGAIRISPDEVGRKLRLIPPERDVIVYCS